MPKRSDILLLQDILQQIQYIELYFPSMQLAVLETDIPTQYTVVRCLEIIGEASGRLSEETKQQMPDIPWRDIKAMRNIISHVYHEIDFTEVLQTVIRDLPPLKASILTYLAQKS